MSPQLWISLLLGLVASVFFYVVPVRLWVAAKTAGAGDAVTFWMLFSLKLRGVPPEVVVNPIIVASVAGVRIDANRLEDLWRKRGDINQVMAAYIASDKFGIRHSFEELASVNLSGQNAIDYVRNEAEARGLDARAKQADWMGQEQAKR